MSGAMGGVGRMVSLHWGALGGEGHSQRPPQGCTGHLHLPRISSDQAPGRACVPGASPPGDLSTSSHGREGSSVGKCCRSSRKEIPPAEPPSRGLHHSSFGDCRNNPALPREPWLRSLLFPLNFPDEGSNSRSDSVDLAGDQLY